MLSSLLELLSNSKSTYFASMNPPNNISKLDSTETAVSDF